MLHHFSLSDFFVMPLFAENIPSLFTALAAFLLVRFKLYRQQKISIIFMILAYVYCLMGGLPFQSLWALKLWKLSDDTVLWVIFPLSAFITTIPISMLLFTLYGRASKWWQQRKKFKAAPKMAAALVFSFSMYSASAAEAPAASSLKKITLGGGCFWSMQQAFEDLKTQGVVTAISGYSGGITQNPTYKQVVSGSTGHREVVQVTYDEKKISLDKVLAHYWFHTDPLDARGQFCDKGEQYRPVIYYSNDSEKKVIEASRLAAQQKIKVKGNFATEILPAKEFWPAEDYHQEFYSKNPTRYKFYKVACRRESRTQELWANVKP